MKLFDYAEEQKLARKIFRIHDEIFSHPAKRYIFYPRLIDVAAGTIYPSYLFMQENIDKKSYIQTN